MWSFITKINREISASNWFYYKNLSRCMVTWNVKLTNLCYVSVVQQMRTSESVLHVIRAPPFHGSKQKTVHLHSTKPRIYNIMNQVI